MCENASNYIWNGSKFLMSETSTPKIKPKLLKIGKQFECTSIVQSDAT